MTSMGTGDSGGVPWRGRTLSEPAFAGDDGTADPQLLEALRRHRGHDATEADVVAALAGTRVLVPVLAVPAGPDDGADMAMVSVCAPDGRSALPVFSSIAALAAWRDDARPVPVEVERAALSAVSEGCALMVLDPGGEAPFLVRRPAVWALAQGWPWTPSPADPQVRAAVARAAAGAARLQGAHTEAGVRAELRVVLHVAGGLDAASLDSVVADVSARLAADELIAERVDSIELRLVGP